MKNNAGSKSWSESSFYSSKATCFKLDTSCCQSSGWNPGNFLRPVFFSLDKARWQHEQVQHRTQSFFRKSSELTIGTISADFFPQITLRISHFMWCVLPKVVYKEQNWMEFLESSRPILFIKEFLLEWDEWTFLRSHTSSSTRVLLILRHCFKHLY